MAQTPEGKVVAALRKEVLQLGVRKVVNYHGTMYSESGHPDTMMLCDYGFMFYVEAKAELPKPTEDQRLYGQGLAQLGFLVYVLGARGVSRIESDGSVTKLAHMKPRECEKTRTGTLNYNAQTRAMVRLMMEDVLDQCSNGGKNVGSNKGRTIKPG